MPDGSCDPVDDVLEQFGIIQEQLSRLAEAEKALADAPPEVTQAWLERQRPVFEAFARFTDCVERIIANAEARKRGEIPSPTEPASCQCVCGEKHPGETVCDTEAVTVRRYVTETGPVLVVLCAPCAVAQGLAEMTP